MLHEYWCEREYVGEIVFGKRTSVHGKPNVLIYSDITDQIYRAFKFTTFKGFLF